MSTYSTTYAQSVSQEERIKELEKKLRVVEEEVKTLKEEKKGDSRIEEIERKLDVIAEEIENIKSVAVVEEFTYEKVWGRAPGASKVYFKDRGLSIGGYGEVVGQFREDTHNDLDALRAVIYVGYKFNDRIILNSEIEFEHATTSENLDGKDGSVSVEFLTLDFLLKDEINLRAGLVLAPFGIINEVHEPTTFFGVLRPSVERFVIPTTWREVGAGFFGDLSQYLPGSLSYTAHIMGSFDSRGFAASSNRGARSKGNRGRFDDPAFVARVEYDPYPGIKFGGSVFIGDTGQNERVDDEGSPFNGQKINGLFQMYETDIQVRYKGFEGRGLLVWTFLDDVALINANNGFVGDESVGKQQFGWYVVGAYNLFSLTGFSSQYLQYLAPFLRYEKLDTQKKVPSGFFRNPVNDRQDLTFGINYKPILNIVLKADWTWNDNEADTGKNQFNLGLGYVF